MYKFTLQYRDQVQSKAKNRSRCHTLHNLVYIKVIRCSHLEHPQLHTRNSVNRNRTTMQVAYRTPHHWAGNVTHIIMNK